MAQQYDSPWKDALHGYLPGMFQIIVPDLFEQIDWSVPHEFLDKELSQIVRDAEVGATRADKLVRLTLKDGKSIRLLFHIEVQAQRDEAFPERMFSYYTRIHELYGEYPESLALLVDPDPSWRPSVFVKRQLSNAIEFKFRSVKLIDWSARIEELENHESPIGLFLAGHLVSLQADENTVGRQVEKCQLFRKLFKRGLESEEIRQIGRLLDWILNLNDILEIQFRAEIEKWQKEENMGNYMGSFERLVLKEAEAKFQAKYNELEAKFQDAEVQRKEAEVQRKEAEVQRKEAEAQVAKIKEAEAKRVNEAKAEGLLLALEIQFGEEGIRFGEELKQRPLEEWVSKLAEHIRGAKSVDTLRTVLE